MTLSPCSVDYLKALTDPFNLGGLPCVPDLVSFPSKKTRTTIYGSFTLAGATTGFGYVACTPLNFVNNQQTVYYSDGIAALTSVKTSDVVNGCSSAYDTQKPYNYVECETNRQVNSRSVGCGLRIRYTGTELNRGGTIVATASADGSLSGKTFSDVATDPTSIRYPVTRNWRTVCFRPSNDSETVFKEGVYPITNDVNDAQNQFRMGFLVQGAPGNTFEFEYVSFSEFVSGSAIPGGLALPIRPDGISKSHTDLAGMSVTRDFLSQGRPEIQSSGGPGLFNMAMDWIGKYSLQDVSSAISTVGSAVMPLLL
jgi:hypothetical protein